MDGRSTSKPLPAGEACFLDPLNGKSEGWPAPGPEAVFLPRPKGNPFHRDGLPHGRRSRFERSLMTYWALGKEQMVAVEYLINVPSLAGKNATFLFAATKIKGCHGGPGRAIALY